MNMPKWPEWETVREIGRGSFGGVYEIQKQVFDRTDKAALKVITIPQSNSDIEELYNDGYDSKSITAKYKNYLEDIVKEYNLMADLKGNQNIVYCDDLRYVQHNDGIGWDIYIKMELLTPLAKSLKSPIEEQQVIKLGIDICNALIACKNKNIIHRDIKPQNIFVSQSGDYKLGDFGIAKTAERTAGGTKTGTYKYMAPEVYNNQPYGTSADLYSLGLVLYWMLNERRTPFLPLPPEIPTASQDNDARLRRMNGERIPAPLNGSQRLKEIVLKACEYNSTERFLSPESMKTELLKLNEHNSNVGRNSKFDNRNDFNDHYVEYGNTPTGCEYTANSDNTMGVSWDDSDNTASGIDSNGENVDATVGAFNKNTSQKNNGNCIHNDSNVEKIYWYIVAMIKIRNNIDIEKDADVKNRVIDEIVKNSSAFILGSVVVIRCEMHSKIFGELNIVVDVSIHNVEVYEMLPIEIFNEKELYFKKEVIEKHINAAYVAYANNKQLDAAKHCIDVLSYEHENVAIWLLLGKIYRELNCSVRALECYDIVISLEPTNGKAYSNAAVAFIALGNNVKAKEYCEKALKFLDVDKEDYAISLANYAVTEARLGNKRRASQLLREAKKHGYKNYDILKKKLGLGFFL